VASSAVGEMFHLAAAQTKEKEQVSKINALVTGGGTFMRILLVVVELVCVFEARPGSQTQDMVADFRDLRHETVHPSDISSRRLERYEEHRNPKRVTTTNSQLQLARDGRVTSSTRLHACELWSRFWCLAAWFGSLVMQLPKHFRLAKRFLAQFHNSSTQAAQVRAAVYHEVEVYSLVGMRTRNQMRP